MEQKTIGKFLAALRKANGYTQRELAEKLNVSDKTISRWERDESAPDLSVLPVLAEIFGVTSDELIRGERISHNSEQQKNEEKTEKLYVHLRNSVIMEYKNQSFVVVGAAGAGFLMALVFNFGLIRARLGFYIGTFFFLAAVMTELIFLNRAFFKLNGEEQQEENKKAKYRVIRITETALTIVFMLFAVSTVLLTKSYSSNTGVLADIFLMYGLVYGIIAVVLCVVVCYFTNEILFRRGVYKLEEKKRAEREKYFWKKTKFMFLCCLIAGVTFFVHIVATNAWNPLAMTEKIRFDEFGAFRDFMEQEGENGAYITSTTDKFGNYFETGTGEPEKILNQNEKIIYSFNYNNTSVVKWEYSDTDDLLPIYVYTQENIDKAQKKMGWINILFGVLYVAELAGFVLCYRKKFYKNPAV